MNKVTSKDGTTIAYETKGNGPAVILVDGTPLFQTQDKTKLKLLKTRAFKNGNVLLTYQSERN